MYHHTIVILRVTLLIPTVIFTKYTPAVWYSARPLWFTYTASVTTQNAVNGSGAPVPLN